MTKKKLPPKPVAGVYDPEAQLRWDLAKAEARLMEIEEDAQLMRDLKRELKGTNIGLDNFGPHSLGDGAWQKLYSIWRRIKTEANMERGAT